MEKLAEGKTKIIWPTADEKVVLIENKDDITAGDGARRDVIEHKGAWANETTCNCFSLLNAAGIPTHFIRREGDRTFLAWLARMLRVELVARRIATGSYLQRYPKVEEGTIFPDLVFEMFYKDDFLHDPLIVWNERHGCIELYNSHVPVGPKAYLFTNPCDLLTPWGDKLRADDLSQLVRITRDVFLVLERAWNQLNVHLADLKIECGWTFDGTLVVADVIDNDIWRIWPRGDQSRAPDKDVYRKLKIVTPEALKQIGDNYTWVAESTRQFLNFK